MFAALVEHVVMGYGITVEGKRGADVRKYAKRAAVAVTRGERVWQELIREVKDIVVVKTGIVLLGNVWSNMTLLWVSGVPLSVIVQHHLTALKGAKAHRKDSAELRQLKTDLAADYIVGDKTEKVRRVAILEDALKNNPVAEMIAAGLMPSIVEDLAGDVDPYAYKTQLNEKTESVMSKLNPTVVKAARAVYMTHDSTLYQGLSRITQLSDFVARYTLYQHLMARKDKPLTKLEAQQKAKDYFVNYDLPLPKGLQFTDDMGLTPFTKYFLNIQRVLFDVAKDNPARVLSLIAMNNWMDLGPIVLDSSAITRVGNNPIEAGAFKLLWTAGDIATISAATTLIK